MRVAAFTKYDREAASTRQRVLQYLPHLRRAGIEVEVHALLDDAYVRSLASGEASSKTAIAAAYARRFSQLLRVQSFDVIWLYAEMFPWLPARLERLAFRSGKPLVYDFDDAFFHAYDDHSNRLVRGALGGKLKPLIRGAAAVCAGNDYLRKYAESAGAEAIVLPTVVDTDQYLPSASRPDRPLTIGWIGSPSTWGFVRPLLPLLSELCRDRGIAFSAVGAGGAAEADRFDGLTFTPWSEASEIAAVQAMDVGIMPLPDEPWARGKCGYKLIQYMACGLPTVASPVGVNSSIVRDGETGYFAKSDAQWRSALEHLNDNPSVRALLGAAGRARAVDGYSLATWAPRLIDLFRSVATASA